MADRQTLRYGHQVGIREKQGERETLKAATELACYVATLHSRPAWLLDEAGDPLKPIEPRIH